MDVPDIPDDIPNDPDDFDVPGGGPEARPHDPPGRPFDDDRAGPATWHADDREAPDALPPFVDDQLADELPAFDREPADTAARVVLPLDDGAPDPDDLRADRAPGPLDSRDESRTDGFRLGDPLDDLLAADRVTLEDPTDLDTGSDADLGGTDADAEPLDDRLQPVAGDVDPDTWASVPAANGAFGDDLVVAALASAGVAAAAAIVRGRRNHDARGVAQAAEVAGVDAIAEHSDIARLQRALTDGATVLVGGPVDEPVLRVVSIDPAAGTVRVAPPAHPERERTEPLDRLRAAWADSAGQLVRFDTADGTVLALPVVLDPLAVP